MWEGDDVAVVEEDPEHFFGDVAYFAAPGAVGPAGVHLEDEGQRLRVGLVRVLQVAEDLGGAFGETAGGGVGGRGEVGD